MHGMSLETPSKPKPNEFTMGLKTVNKLHGSSLNPNLTSSYKR